MINEVNVILLSQFLGLYCLFKLFIWLTYDVFLISFLFRFISCLHQLHLPLFLIKKGKCYIIKSFSRLVLSIQAYYMVNSRCSFNTIII